MDHIWVLVYEAPRSAAAPLYFSTEEKAKEVMKSLMPLYQESYFRLSKRQVDEGLRASGDRWRGWEFVGDSMRT
jgi:hypothetical protein